MKAKTLILTAGATIALLAATAFGFLTWREYKRMEQQSIMRVLESNRQIALESFVVKSGLFGPVTNFNSAAYLSHAREIRFVDCPQDFRKAWLNYIQVCDRLQDFGAIKRLAYASAFTVSTYNRRSEGMDYAIQRMDGLNVQEAYHQLQTACLTHGIQF